MFPMSTTLHCVGKSANYLTEGRAPLPRSSFAWSGPLTFFHHIQAVSTITDNQPATRENRILIGQGRSVPVSRDGPSLPLEAILSFP